MGADVVALTAQGRLRGVRDGQAWRFLGIPYAESPATAGRFSAPVPHARWDGVRDALAYGATSPQAAAGGPAFTYDFRWTAPAGPLAGLAFHFVTADDPGWERVGAGRSPVMIFGKPSEVREDPLELERAAWG